MLRDAEVLNFPAVCLLAVIPLSKVWLNSTISAIATRVLIDPQLLTFATDELSIRLSETQARLLNATLVHAPIPLIFFIPCISQNFISAVG